MAQGGARARSGPAPDPDALRRERDSGGWVKLPAAGRMAPVPLWPLTEPTDRELSLWDAEWRRPQALMWERNGQQLEVALYVRSLVAAESKDAPTIARTLVRQQQEALGLSVPGLHRNRWLIEAVADRPAEVRSSASSRSRLKVVERVDGA